MPESAILEEARRWVVENYPYNREHLLRALEWLDRLAPGAPEAVRLAALTHDMERAFPGPDSPAMESLADPAVAKRLTDLGQEIPPAEQQTPAALSALLKAEMEKWDPIIRGAGIKAE